MLSVELDATFSTRPLTNTHDWPAASASEATALRRYTNQIIIIIIYYYFAAPDKWCPCKTQDFT